MRIVKLYKLCKRRYTYTRAQPYDGCSTASNLNGKFPKLARYFSHQKRLESRLVLEICCLVAAAGNDTEISEGEARNDTCQKLEKAVIQVLMSDKETTTSTSGDGQITFVK